jgi:hypothetical protein
MKNTNEQAEEHVADEAAVYRALVCAVANTGKLRAAEMEGVPKKSPITVGAYRLRRKLRNIDQ